MLTVFNYIEFSTDGRAFCNNIRRPSLSREEPCQSQFPSTPIYNTRLLLLLLSYLLSLSPLLSLQALFTLPEFGSDASGWPLLASPTLRNPSWMVPPTPSLSSGGSRFVLVFLARDAWPPIRWIFSRWVFWGVLVFPWRFGHCFWVVETSICSANWWFSQCSPFLRRNRREL